MVERSLNSNGCYGWKINQPTRTLREQFDTARGLLNVLWPTEVFFPGAMSDNSTFAAISDRPTQSDIIRYLHWIDSL